MTTVGRVYRFRAVHSLPEFAEPYCYPHAHDYTVEVIAIGGCPTETLDNWWWANGITDHEAINARFDPSTVENIAEMLLQDAPTSVVAVVVWEDKQRWGRAQR